MLVWNILLSMHQKPRKFPVQHVMHLLNVISNLKDDSSPKSALRRLMIKSVGETDMGIQEVMHLIISLKFHHSTYRVITVSLDNSSNCKISCSELSASKSDLEVYAERQQLGKDLHNTIFFFFYCQLFC